MARKYDWAYYNEGGSLPIYHLTYAHISTQNTYCTQQHTPVRTHSQIYFWYTNQPTERVFPRPMQCAKMHPDPSSFFNCCSDSTQQFHINLTATIHKYHLHYWSQNYTGHLLSSCYHSSWLSTICHSTMSIYRLNTTFWQTLITKDMTKYNSWDSMPKTDWKLFVFT